MLPGPSVVVRGSRCARAQRLRGDCRPSDGCRPRSRDHLRRTFMFMHRLALLTLLLVAPIVNADVIRVDIDGVIHPISQEFVERAIDEGIARKADAVVIVLRTPGGLDTSMRG